MRHRNEKMKEGNCMIEIEKPQIECIEDSANSSYGKYVVEPLERGYGITLGNALRRIMLSSLPGTAATAIKIAGVQHEFSTIPGVKEDVTEIVLNVKSLITKLHNAEGTKTVFIEATGPCEVKAGDIKCDSEVEVLNPDLHIATLDAGATLNMELTLSHGRGYVPADRNKPAQTTIGLIPVDSIYTPVYKVNYTVENTRVGNMTDFDKLTLEVWTDGTISPRDAVSLGAKILCDHFALFTDLSDTLGDKSTVVEKAQASSLEYRVDLPETLAAPIQQGQQVGTLTLCSGDTEVLTVPILAAESVPGRSWGRMFTDLLKQAVFLA